MKSLALAFALLASPAGAHEWYSGLADAAGQGCCEEQHCRMVPREDVRFGEAGDIAEIRDPKDGAWLPVPDGALLDVPSPDGNFHACIVGGDSLAAFPSAAVTVSPRTIRCVILPGML